MKTYQLENKDADERFLKGESIQCPAVMPVTGLLNPGDRLVILLSNGKKYMGEITNFDHTIKGNHAEGSLQIIRYPRK
jgi:hypothetical protein